MTDEPPLGENPEHHNGPTEEAGGALLVVATPIGSLSDLSDATVQALESADIIAAEDTRRTRQLLTHAGITAKRVVSVRAETEHAAIAGIENWLDQDKTIALVSDAGMPAISDPGQRVVDALIGHGRRVEVVPGPDAASTALAKSGYLTSEWAFEGFLPRKGAARADRLAALAIEPAPVALYESPKRVTATLADLASACGPDRPAAVCAELTKKFERIEHGTLGELADAFKGQSPRGEYVIVIGPAATGQAAS